MELEDAAQADRRIISYPRINLGVDNPIQELVSAPEFAKTAASVSKIEASKRALVSTDSLALIYALVRNVRPRHVVEIGTYNAGTSELICQALLENGFGLLHTVGPFDAERVIPIVDSWSPTLLQHLQFYPMTSMEFYYEMSKLGISPRSLLLMVTTPTKRLFSTSNPWRNRSPEAAFSLLTMYRKPDRTTQLWTS